MGSACQKKSKTAPQPSMSTSPSAIIDGRVSFQEIRQGIIGRNTVYQSIFGSLVTLYADDTASGRPHRRVEDYINSILPIYANTHSDNSYFPTMMSAIFNKSREYLLKIFNASSKYCILGTGTGCTGAIYHFQEILLKKFPKIVGITEKQARPLCIVTQYEHHSNILSWEKWGFDVQPIAHTAEDDWEKGLKDLESKIRSNLDRPLIVISLSGASNVTSQETPLVLVSNLIKQEKASNGGLKDKLIWCVDLAALASHKRIDIRNLEVDAAFISPHKLTGGPGSSGLLIFNTNFYNLESEPTRPAGGTVDGVFGYKPNEIIFTQSLFERETAGTPGIIQFVRAALAFQLQDLVGLNNIIKREEELRDRLWSEIQKMNAEWKEKGQQTDINVLGTHNFQNRLSVFSIQIKDPQGNIYNHMLIHRILNDVFGIQVRSGCNCAGPFGIQLLSLTEERVNYLAEEFKKGILIEKPGWLRFNIHYSFTEEDFNYLVFSLKFCSEHGREIESKFYQRNEDGGYCIRQERKINHKGTLHSISHELGFDISQLCHLEEIKEENRNLHLMQRKEQVQKFLGKN